MWETEDARHKVKYSLRTQRQAHRWARRRCRRSHYGCPLLSLLAQEEVDLVLQTPARNSSTLFHRITALRSSLRLVNLKPAAWPTGAAPS
jgi:hypothetical protein